MEFRLNLKQNAFHTLHRAILEFRSRNDTEETVQFDHDDHSLTFLRADGTKGFYLDEGYTHPPGYYNLKFCILGLIQTLELLLKEALRAENPNSIFTDSSHTKTISLSSAVKKIQDVMPNLFNEAQLSAVIQAKELRNTIEHYEVRWTSEALERIAKYLFSVIMHFCYSVFNIRLAEYYAFDARIGTSSEIVDIIRDLVQNTDNMPSQVSLLSQWSRQNPEDRMLFCIGCGHQSCSSTLKKCILCGEELSPLIEQFQ